MYTPSTFSNLDSFRLLLAHVLSSGSPYIFFVSIPFFLLREAHPQWLADDDDDDDFVR